MTFGVSDAKICWSEMQEAEPDIQNYKKPFSVVSPDMRLQRPEYLGGGKSPVNIAPVPQTSRQASTGR